MGLPRGGEREKPAPWDRPEAALVVVLGVASRYTGVGHVRRRVVVLAGPEDVDLRVAVGDRGGGPGARRGHGKGEVPTGSENGVAAAPRAPTETISAGAPLTGESAGAVPSAAAAALARRRACRVPRRPSARRARGRAAGGMWECHRRQRSGCMSGGRGGCCGARPASKCGRGPPPGRIGR